MPLLHTKERRLLETLSKLAFCNPFLPERRQLELALLGDDFCESAAVWSRQDEEAGQMPNVERLTAKVAPLVNQISKRLQKGDKANPDELQLFEDAALYCLYDKYRAALRQLMVDSETKKKPVRWKPWPDYLHDFQQYLCLPNHSLRSEHDAAHLLACFYQLSRAFHYIYEYIFGGSLPAARLRASIWQSIFTHDMRRYRRTLYRMMGDVTTLVTGPSGTGKELVARAIGSARYLPFDETKQQFDETPTELFFAVNLSALSPTLIESELFGHRHGAFTGAVEDRVGWLESCGERGTVFLDEIGELETSIQVKLLRVLQARCFSRLGETATRTFSGKIIAATNRDLAAEIATGTFREDFYYRLCADRIATPSLHDQLADSPANLGHLVLHLARRILNDDDEADMLAQEATEWIETNLGHDYAWPGNVRELEQCVRNILIRREYHPNAARGVRSSGDPASQLAAQLRAGELSAEEVTRHYATWIYSQVGSYEETARRLKLDRRTIKSKIDEELLAEWKSNTGGY